MKKPNLPIIILCLAICVSGIAALSLKTFHTVNSTTSPYLLYLKVLQGNQQFYNVESGDYLDIHQLKETIQLLCSGSTEMYRCPGHPLTPISVTSIFSASIIIAEPSSTRIYSNLNISPSEFS